MNKKINAIFAALSAVILGLMLLMPSVYAREEGENDQGRNNASIMSTSTPSRHDGEYENEEEIGEIENEEDDIHNNIDRIQKVLDKKELPELKSENLIKYGDAISILKDYQSFLQQLKNMNITQTQTSSTLNANERALLEKITGKNTLLFSSLDSRISEINKNIQEMIDLLAPIADQPISNSYGLRKIIISAIENFKDQIEKIKELENLDIQAVEENFIN